MDDPVILDLVCPECAAELPTYSDFSGRVGATEDESTESFIHARWAVLLLLFGVLAGFGLPLLWKSREFSRGGKVLLTMIVLAYTALLIWLIIILSLSLFEQYETLMSAWSTRQP